ncbi:glycoside hydrolase family 16 protein [Pseudonocardia sp. GCM10023141]|uniref:glycoside hydrolase family 16 protein n=1 Tax=Pseudonocardia sp. GCM10023141 TaxID=3252653 RepID=UPI0036075128
MSRHALPESATPADEPPASSRHRAADPAPATSTLESAGSFPSIPASSLPAPRRAPDDAIPAFDPFGSFDDFAKSHGYDSFDGFARSHGLEDVAPAAVAPAAVAPAAVAPTAVAPAAGFDLAPTDVETTAVDLPVIAALPLEAPSVETPILHETEDTEDAAPTRRSTRHRTPPPNGPRTGHRMPSGPGRKRKRTIAVLVVAAAITVGLPSAGVAAVDQCNWMRAAHQLVLALNSGDDSKQATQLRKALDRAGVGDELPAECAATGAGATVPVVDAPATDTPATSGHGNGNGHGGNTATPTPAPVPTTSPKPAPAPVPVAPKPPAAAAAAGTGTGTSAADKFGWGTPVKSDDFTAGLGGWGLYDGAGHGGNGRRTPSAASVLGGVLTIAGDAAGNTEGMAWGKGQKYGRWEGRVKAPVGAKDYNALLLLWPDAENWPVGGEVDFMEMSDHSRQSTNMFLHYGSSNSQLSGTVNIDATQWHNWAVEWTPDHIATFVDGKEWFRTTDKSALPPGPMHLCIQLDYFPGSGGGGNNQMQVDWIKQYAL